jgi:hypothetical protein
LAASISPQGRASPGGVTLKVVLARHDRRSGRLAVACALASAAVVACGSFGEAPAGSDGDAGVGNASEAGAADASTGASDGGGGQGDDGAPPGTCTPPCETFETSEWSRLWPRSASGSGVLEVTEGESTSGTRALDLAIRAADGEAVLSFSAGVTPRRIVASVNVLVLVKGDGELDLFEIVEGPELSARGIHFVHQASSGSYVSESSASYPKQILPLGGMFATYTRVTLELDFNASRYTVMVGSQVRATGELDTTWKPSVLFVMVGAAYTQNVTKPWHVRFDDVSVVTEP